MRWLMPIILLGCAPHGAVDEHELLSEHTGSTYTLSTFVPEACVQACPLVVALDGDTWGARTVRIVDQLVLDVAIAPAVVINVGYADGNERLRDYTPPAPDAPEGSGGVEAFYDFLELELLPWAAQELPVADDPGARTLLGHSFGGLAAVHGLLHRQGFERWVALSPSLYWGDGLLFDDLEQRDEPLRGRLYMTAGSMEDFGMAALVGAFDEALEPQLELARQTEILAGEYHGSIYPEGAERGLLFAGVGP